MSSAKNVIAIGRSRYLFEGIKHLATKGYSFKAIITEEAYDEYDIKHQDFENLAREIGSAFFMSKSLYTDEILKVVRENNVRVAISVNWKYTIPKKFLDLFECGILNYHLGNLPDYKGNATVNWTIIDNQPYINGNIHKMDPELDAGDIICRETIQISDDMYVGDLVKKAEEHVPRLYEKALATVLADPNAYEVKGSEQGLRCYPRLPEDSQIDWKQDAASIRRLIRSSSHPYKGAYSFLNGEKVVFWNADVVIPRNKFLATPGHVIAIEKETKSILIACVDGFLRVNQIGYNGDVMPPGNLIKSIRVRFK